MRHIISALLYMFLAALIGHPASAASLGLHEVVGVEDGDMLKLRAGPGTGYVVIVGLPNGTAINVQSCDRIGATRWCSVSLTGARCLSGHVSGTYLRPL